MSLECVLLLSCCCQQLHYRVSSLVSPSISSDDRSVKLVPLRPLAKNRKKNRKRERIICRSSMWWSDCLVNAFTNDFSRSIPLLVFCRKKRKENRTFLQAPHSQNHSVSSLFFVYEISCANSYSSFHPGQKNLGRSSMYTIRIHVLKNALLDSPVMKQCVKSWQS